MDFTGPAEGLPQALPLAPPEALPEALCGRCAGGSQGVRKVPEVPGNARYQGPTAG